MIKIALGHKAQQGKDTFFDIVKTEIEPNVINLKVAEMIYKGSHQLQELYNLPICKDRELLQLIGTHYRTVNKDFWINQVVNKISQIDKSTTPKHMILTDCRHKNEFDILKKLGFTMIKVIRPGIFVTQEVSQHSSENDLNNETGWDIVIENTSDIDEYRKIIRNIWRKLSTDKT